MAETICITSLGNTRIKRANSLRNRAHRDKSGLMLIEGFREIARAQTNNHQLLELFFCNKLFRGANEADLLLTAKQQGAQLCACTEPVFSKLSYRDLPDGLLAIAPKVSHKLIDIKPLHNSIILVAESIEKPGNLGTMMRSADAAGAHVVIVCDGCTDINNPNVVRSSVGTLFSLPIIDASTEDVLKWLKKHNITTIAASPNAELVYTDCDFTGKIAFVVGAEQYGLSEPWYRAAHYIVKIPMIGQVDSLNVANAATLLLYEAVRQKTNRTGRFA